MKGSIPYSVIAKAASLAYNSRRSSRRPMPRSAAARYARPRFQKQKFNPVEVKYKLHTHSHDFALSNPHGAVLTTILNGSSRDQRVGNTCKLLNIKGTWKAPTSDSSTVRFIIYIPRSSTDVISLGLIHQPIDPNEFIVLYDKFWSPDDYTPDDTINFNIPLNRTVRYNGPNSTDYITPVVKYVAMTSGTTGTRISLGNWITTFIG